MYKRMKSKESDSVGQHMRILIKVKVTPKNAEQTSTLIHFETLKTVCVSVYLCEGTCT